MERKNPNSPVCGTVSAVRCGGGGKLSGSRVQPVQIASESTARVRDRVTNPDCNAGKTTKAAGSDSGRLDEVGWSGRRADQPFFAGGFSTVRLLITGPKLKPAEEARIPATCFSMELLTKPVRVTVPLSTIMWIDGIAPMA